MGKDKNSDQQSNSLPANPKLKQILQEKSKNFLKHSTEFTLYTLLFPFTIMGAGRHPKDIRNAAAHAAEIAHYLTNPDEAPPPWSHHPRNKLEQKARQRFERRLYYLREKGLIETIGDKVKEIRITRAGQKRLRQIFPIYLTSRPWDKKVYLVTYDIPEKRRKDRDTLRNKLQRLGCAIYQRSVWVSVYDPRKILRNWSREHNFTDQVIVSDIGKDGSIAGKTIPELIRQLFNLEDVNTLYEKFINQYHNCNDPNRVDQWQFNLDWANCVEKDPQLPFELLPRDFSDKQAYKIYRQLSKVNLQEQLIQLDPSPWRINEDKYLRNKRQNRTDG